MDSKGNLMAHFTFFCVLYDINEIRNLLLVFDKNEIKYKTKDKSNMTNFRMPQSTYIEVEIYISENDFDRADALANELFGN
jgi:hypothetical protein